MAVTDTDQQIRQNVWDEISHDVRIDSSNIIVTVTDGVVYPAGTVPTYSPVVSASHLPKTKMKVPPLCCGLVSCVIRTN